MTDQQAQVLASDMMTATSLVSKINNQRNRIAGGYDIPTDEPGPINIVAQALADERRRALEEAAKMAEEKAERSIKGEHLNIPEYNFGYRGGLRGLADEIRLKLYAKAHAGQEGG